MYFKKTKHVRLEPDFFLSRMLSLVRLSVQASHAQHHFSQNSQAAHNHGPSNFQLRAPPATQLAIHSASVGSNATQTCETQQAAIASFKAGG